MDIGGRVARRFGAATSGQGLLYDRAGRLRFQGGLTSARGHAGDNAGSAAIVALAQGRVPDTVETPVYGCPLFASSQPSPSQD
jgi:hypothetical protein